VAQDGNGPRVTLWSNRRWCNVRNGSAVGPAEALGVGRTKRTATQWIQLPFRSLQRYLAVHSDRVRRRNSPRVQLGASCDGKSISALSSGEEPCDERDDGRDA
jgi:hypothetical protein